jgi:Mut7-C ubiquitin
MKAPFRFDPALSVFLKKEHRNERFEYDCARAATLKNAIEALGVPHIGAQLREIAGALRAQWRSASFQPLPRLQSCARAHR